MGKENATSLIIIDGLDETSRDTAQLLFKMTGRLPDWIHSLFTTRYDETMVSYYAPATRIQLDGNSQPNRDDITQYVSYRLGDSTTNNRVAQIVSKAEGSFIYAKTLCDILLAKQIEIQDLRSLPTGIVEFYQDFMRRLFPTVERFAKARPFFELLSTDETIYEAVVCLCTQLDNYELWELRRWLGSLVISEQEERRESRYRVLRFAHKTIRDWISDQTLAGDYYVDSQSGYRLLLQTCDYLQTDCVDTDELLAKLGRRETKADLQWMLYANIYRWMVKAGSYDRYKNILLSSFDDVREKGSAEINAYGLNHLYYYRFYDKWRWADELPLNTSVNDLISILEEIIRFPRTLMCSEFAHRSFQISLLLLRDIMKTGRFQSVFYTFMRQLNYSYYFMSSASDLNGETRDGWDKYYMARDAAICLKALLSLGVSVPDDVRAECERMKLTYNYYLGKREGMFSDSGSSGPFSYGILANRELYKDVCTYTPSEFEKQPEGRFKELEKDLVHYNTTSLRYYLAHGEDNDDEFVRTCADYHADIATACTLASEDIRGGKRFDAPSRLDYIESVKARFSR